jgi:hypothetical protein
MTTPAVAPFTRLRAAVVAPVRRLIARYQWINAEIWRIAKTDGPDNPKRPGQPPKTRCC